LRSAVLFGDAAQAAVVGLTPVYLGLLPLWAILPFLIGPSLTGYVIVACLAQGFLVAMVVLVAAAGTATPPSLYARAYVMTLVLLVIAPAALDALGWSLGLSIITGLAPLSATWAGPETGLPRTLILIAAALMLLLLAGARFAHVYPRDAETAP
jgi:hypothetical protein